LTEHCLHLISFKHQKYVKVVYFQLISINENWLIGYEQVNYNYYY